LTIYFSSPVICEIFLIVDFPEPLETPPGSLETSKKVTILESQSEEFIPKQQSSEYPLQTFNVLLLGIDARNIELSRTDLIMLANINPTTKKIHVISIQMPYFVMTTSF